MPKIIPKFFIHLEKFMKGVSASIDEFAEREHVDDLRDDLERDIKEANETIEQKRIEDLEEKD